MHEFRKSATKLGRGARREVQAAYFETISHLNTVLTQMQDDVSDIKIRLGKLASDATIFAAQEAAALVEPLAVRLDTLANDVADLKTRVAELEARAMGAPSRALGGEG